MGPFHGTVGLATSQHVPSGREHRPIRWEDLKNGLKPRASRARLAGVRHFAERFEDWLAQPLDESAGGYVEHEGRTQGLTAWWRTRLILVIPTRRDGVFGGAVPDIRFGSATGVPPRVSGRSGPSASPREVRVRKLEGRRDWLPRS